jgi:hypothetical protein
MLEAVDLVAIAAGLATWTAGLAGGRALAAAVLAANNITNTVCFIM